jgi:hypothetical protein
MKNLLRITANSDSRIFSPEEMSALFALRSTESHFEEGLSGVVFVGIFLELWPHESLDFLGLKRGLP